jgi:hypothetical protein
MCWELGIVIDIYKGKDGIARTVKLHTVKGPRVRAIQRLHNLELVSCNEPNEPESESIVDKTDVILPGGKMGQQNGSKVEQFTDHDENLSLKTVVTRTGRVVRPVNRLDL